MDKISFTLCYNGKTVACVKEGNFYTAQVSYTPLHLDRIESDDGKVTWLDKDLQRVTPLSEEIGWLIQEQFLNESSDQ
ncbi:MAG TPA: hypothetical protein VM843_07335 [Flavisolibacter sp.]|jgi:hypothetical protein|nr:hypothetical protein [Flavisolibacter sp.]